MKRILLFATTVLFLVMAFLMPCVTAHAGGFDLQEHYEKMKAKREKQEREYMEKWLDDLEADGNLTQAAIDAAGEYGRGRTPNHKSTQSSAGTYSGGGSGSSAYTGPGKGWVYSVDELHVIGLPEGENGYTKPGWYGDIE